MRGLWASPRTSAGQPPPGAPERGTRPCRRRPSARAGLSPVLLVLTAACALLGGTVALAGPAAAIEDPRRPTAEVTSGPSCGPAASRSPSPTAPRRTTCALVFDGAAEQTPADVAPASRPSYQRDVDWGRTVDVTVTVTGPDGTVEEPLRLGTYTRPSAEDCAALPRRRPRHSSGTTTDTPPSPTSATPTGSVGDPSTSATEPHRRPAGRLRRPSPDTSTSPPTRRRSARRPAAEERSRDGGRPSAASVSPGGVVTVRAAGFDPGRRSPSPSGRRGPADHRDRRPDGRVEAVVQIPRAAALGAATVQLVGGALRGRRRARPAGRRPQPAGRGADHVGPGLAAGWLIGAAGCWAWSRPGGRARPPRAPLSRGASRRGRDPRMDQDTDRATTAPRPAGSPATCGALAGAGPARRRPGCGSSRRTTGSPGGSTRPCTGSTASRSPASRCSAGSPSSRGSGPRWATSPRRSG